MQYNPAPNQVGAIMQGGMNNAALYNLQGMQSIGDSLRIVAKTYADNEKTKAEGRAFKQVFGVVAPAMGINEEQLKQITGGLKNDNDWAEFGRQQTGSIGSMIQYGMYGPNGSARGGGSMGQPRVLDTASGMMVFDPNTRQVTPMLDPTTGEPIVGRTGLAAFPEDEYGPSPLDANNAPLGQGSQPPAPAADAAITGTVAQARAAGYNLPVGTHTLPDGRVIRVTP